MPIVKIIGPISQPLVLDRGYSVSVTPLSGSCRVQIPGEAVSETLTAAASYGPYSARRDVVMTIDSGVVEYDVDEAGGAGGPTTLPVMQAAFDAGTATERAAFQSSVSGGGSITDAQAQTGSLAGAAIGEKRTITDGSNAGVVVRWYQPSGLGAPAWCWDIYPQSKYEG